ncbi:hypothetical protein BV394_11895 [Brevirhabdus pacifica]|uniref:Uncharacterized protein n=1 Tax=Brevirhabdus pacifica TaxID=1267768 RepID=A0A1U7DKC5_9RHOB|nr:M10 family metallopeptidase C-terminal domain-containing protein [Brevirhabdus pacifica]APX90343.1 hypothetical protein BV394_11895 [Brevirhabdus pacifica]PJJ80796.1 pre-peptidase [Brevirhabdus pacifica]
MIRASLEDEIAASIRGDADSITDAAVVEGTDAPEGTSTGYTLTKGDSFSGSLSGDGDWIAISVTAGDNIQITMSGGGTGGVSDAYLLFYDGAGELISFNDDGGNGLDAQFEFVASESGTYYVAAWALTGSGYLGGSGSYTLTVTDLGEALPEYDDDQIAAYLTDGYWQDGGGQGRAFALGADRSISVDITSLTSAGQQYATWALEAWSDVSGIEFVFVDEDLGQTADIFFDDSDSGAYSWSTTSGGTILRSVINVSTAWIQPDLVNGQATINSYSYSTYLHEIGHALGLGHAGDYNGAADYGTTLESGDNHYLNDSWLNSVMSYMDPWSNTTDGLDYAVHLTPMQADIIAIQSLYGDPGAQHAGDTVYGRGSTAGGYLDLWTGASGDGLLLTIFDTGGNDTLDLGHASQDQVIDLRPGAISDVLGLPNSLTIDRSTVIENVVSGSGNDTITGNDADNRITGGGGADRIDGGAGQDSVVFSGNAASYTITTSGAVTEVSGNGATATLNNVETLIFDDQTVSLVASSATVSIADQSVASGRWISLISILTLTGGSGNVSAYEIQDNSGADSVYVDGAGIVDASAGYIISASQLGGVWLQGEAVLGDQTIRVRAYDDQTGWGDWESFVLSTDNYVPRVADLSVTVGVGSFVAVKDLLDYSDADGDAAVSYEILDLAGESSFYLSGVGQVDASAGYVLDAGQLANLYVEGASAEGSQTLRIRAYDGKDWGDWAAFEVTTADTVGTVTVADQTLSVGRWTSLGANLTYTDADGDTAMAYQITDSSGQGIYISGVGAVDASAGYEITADQLWSVWIQSDSTLGTRSLSIRAYDGTSWTESYTFHVVTANHLATIDSSAITVAAGGSSRLADALTVADADGDAVVAYEVIDAVGADSLYLDGVGTLQASGGLEITAAELADLWVLGDDAAGDQFIFIRAHDGTEWGDWTAVYVETTDSTASAQAAPLATQGDTAPQQMAEPAMATLPDADWDAALRDSFIFV